MQVDLQKVNYTEKLSKVHYNRDYRENLKILMNMGFFDFDKNLRLLS